MSDYSLPSNITLVFGAPSTGKTSFAFRYLLNAPAACRFIFDDQGQAAKRLQLRACHTDNDCEKALASRWVCFNPHLMFPGAKLEKGFQWFCHWVYEVSKRGPGRKIFFVDELWQWQDPRSGIPPQLETVLRTGRIEGLDFLTCTHCPRDYHVKIRSWVTEWVCFNTIEPAELEAVRPYYPRVDQAAKLPPGSFLAYNRVSGAELAGRVF